MGEQLGNAGRVVDAGLAARDVAHMLAGVGEHELEMPLEQVPHRLPVDPCGLHRHVGDAVTAQPLLQLDERCGRGGEASRLLHARLAHAAHSCDDKVVFVDIQSRAARIEHIHGLFPLGLLRRESPQSSKSINRAPGPRGPWQQFAVRAGARVQLLNGLAALRIRRPRCRRQDDLMAQIQPNIHCPDASVLADTQGVMGNY